MNEHSRTHTPPVTSEHDVIVVGGRCAGAATALLLARQGHDVLVLERGQMPSDTLSTHAISRGGVVQLDRWGLLDDVVGSGAPRVTSTEYHLPGHAPIVRPVGLRAGVDFLLAPRRFVLDEILLDAARAAGATVATRMTVTGVTRTPDGRVDGVTVREFSGEVRTVRARMVIGADGVRSRIARAVGAPVLDARAADGAAHYTYVDGLDGDGFEMHAAERGFAGVFRTHDDQANVWMSVPADRALHGSHSREDAFLDLLASIAPTLAERVRAAEIVAPVRGEIGLPNHVLQPAGPGWALVGDAGYHRDPITGHGITDAFRDAELLARHLGCVLAGRTDEAAAMAGYRADRDRAIAGIFDVTTQLAAFPPVTEFTKRWRAFTLLLDLEAEWLAARPPLPTRDQLVAA
jgi:2-polyprenyl-6-methoxyphenol hydroxylase-like FAD-dependent oxidoreductase